jgi:hypothetical protein
MTDYLTFLNGSRVLAGGETPAPDTHTARASFTDRVADLFAAHPGRWIGSQELARVGGICGWRTRVSNVRRSRNWQIDNRVRRLPSGARISEYRLTVEVSCSE